jgi:hypothetical protein
MNDHDEQEVSPSPEPPAVPPKQEQRARHSLEVSTLDITNNLASDPDTSALSQTPSAEGDASDDMLEGSPVQRMSHSTFIAPALPPIRFSMSGAGFAELLGVVGGPSLRALEELSERSEGTRSSSGSGERVSGMPSPTSGSFERPNSDVTVIGSYDHGSSSLADEDNTIVWKGDESAHSISLGKSSSEVDR